LSFLGSWAHGDPAVAARLLLTDSDEWTTRRLLEIYAPAEEHQRHRRVADGATLPMRKAIVAHRDPGAAMTLLASMEPSALRASSLLPLLAHVARLRDGEGASVAPETVLQAVGAALPATDIVALLASDNRLARWYALADARYRPEQRIARAVLDALPRLSDDERLAAHETLSIFAGRELRPEQIEEARLGWGLTVASREACTDVVRSEVCAALNRCQPMASGVLPSSCVELASETRTLINLNVCMRRWLERDVTPETRADVERRGWWRPMKIADDHLEVASALGCTAE
jgi:hypothetical protein